MAGFLSMLPGLFGAAKSSGILDKVANVAGDVLSDIGSGKIGSWGDFGKSLARGGAALLGSPSAAPPPNPLEVKEAQMNKVLLENSKNAADQHNIMLPASRRDDEPQRHAGQRARGYVPPVQEPVIQAPVTIVKPPTVEKARKRGKKAKKGKKRVVLL